MKAVAKIESDFNPRERTGSYIGLFQLSKKWDLQFDGDRVVVEYTNDITTGKGDGMKIETWHRRHAVMLASQLPDGIEDARIILRLATELVNDFLAEPEQPARPVATVVSIRSDDCA